MVIACLREGALRMGIVQQFVLYTLSISYLDQSTMVNKALVIQIYLF
jgi:hypothetical protein